IVVVEEGASAGRVLDEVVLACAAGKLREFDPGARRDILEESRGGRGRGGVLNRRRRGCFRPAARQTGQQRRHQDKTWDRSAHGDQGPPEGRDSGVSDSWPPDVCAEAA